MASVRSARRLGRLTTLFLGSGSLLFGLVAPVAAVDTTAPSVSAPVLSATSVIQYAPVSVTTSATDPSGVSSTQMQLDGGSWRTMSPGSSQGPTTTRGGAAVFGNVTHVRVGNGSSCAVLSGGSVRCWGDNNLGQLGDGTTTPRLFPKPVSGITTATDVAIGDGHACALLTDHTIKCWGDDSLGEMGNGTQSGVAVTTPVLVSGISTATAITAGSQHTCALLADATVRCWGSNSGGQLGVDYNLVDLKTTPYAVPGATSVTAITAGHDFSCALVSGGTVRCWGYDDQDQDGQAPPICCFGYFTATPVPGISGATGIDAGGAHACARLSSGGVKCWGDNSVGQLGNGTVGGFTTPVTVSGITTAASVSVGPGHSCASLADGTVRCWGANHLGQLGDGTATDRSTPVTTTGVAGATAVSAGSNMSCARLTDGSIRCWGFDNGDQLGYSIPRTPVQVSGVSTAVAVDAGHGHTCALLSTGTAKCWGADDWGQLGGGNLGGLTGITSIGLGDRDSCALVTGQIRCVGIDDVGFETSTPVTIAGISGATAIGIGGYGGCGVIAGGAVKCWGENQNGQLGDGTTTDRPGAVSVTGLSGAIAVAMGYYHTCALISGGTVKCWGANDKGELGDGTTTERHAPVAVSGITTAVSIALGWQDTCAVLADGTVRCWGDNAYGEFGNGTCGPCTSSTPLAVPGITTATSVSAQGATNCALLSSGAAQCWGANESGQLGDGSIGAPGSVVSVAGLTTAVSLAIGWTQGCAVLADKTTRCWGDNSSGQVGGVHAVVAPPDGFFGLPAAGTHQVCVRATDTAGNTSDGTACATLTVVDKTAPTTTAPVASLRTGVSLSSGALRAALAWTGTDNAGGVGIDHYEIAKSSDGGTTWTTLSSTLTTTAATISLASGASDRFRIRAFDKAGNVGGWATGPVFQPMLVQETGGPTFSASWLAGSSTSYSGGGLEYSTSAGATASYTFTGSAIALVTTEAATRGAVKVYVDGVLSATVDTYAATTAYQVQAWSKGWTTAGTHTVKLVVVGTAGRPRVDVDAFAVLAGAPTSPPPTGGGEPPPTGGGQPPTDTAGTVASHAVSAGSATVLYALLLLGLVVLLRVATPGGATARQGPRRVSRRRHSG